MAEFKKTRWTVSEDTFLKESLISNKSAEDVAALLNRTKDSVTTRKWHLKLEGRFKAPAKSETSTAYGTVKVNGKVQVVASVNEDPFLWKIEKNVPLPSRGAGSKEATELLIQKVKNLMEKIKVGESFVVPRNAVRHITSVAKTDYEAYKIRTSATSKEKKFFRVFRIA